MKFIHRHPFVFVGSVGLFLYLCGALFLYLRQDALLFLPPATPMSDCPSLLSADIIDMYGTRAYYIHDKNDVRRLAVSYHGNGERACDSAWLVPVLDELGYDVLLVEYAGYAGDLSGRKPSVALLKKDVENTITWITNQRLSAELVIGRSIGTGFATYHAERMPPRKLLLVSPFDTLRRLVQDHSRIYPAALLLKEDLDNRVGGGRGGKVLIVHGENDVAIPISRGRALFASLPQEKTIFIAIPGVQHNDVLTPSALSQIIRWIDDGE